MQIKPEKVEVIYEGVANLAKGRDSLFAAKLEAEETLSGYNIRDPFLLYVGNAYPHKNLEGLIDVFGEIISSPFNKGGGGGFLGGTKEEAGKSMAKYSHINGLAGIASSSRGGTPRNDIRLVLVGKEDYFYKRIKNYAEEKNLWKENDLENSKVIFPGYVPDAKLEILFKRACAYVFPSFYEGFGLPPLEAMAKGCPVVSSNKTCLPEVLGGAAIYFNPENEEEMKAQIEKVISDEDLRQELIKKGLEQVKRYSWWEAARETLEVYKEVLK